jgi:hypothetical protein
MLHETSFQIITDLWLSRISSFVSVVGVYAALPNSLCNAMYTQKHYVGGDNNIFVMKGRQMIDLKHVEKNEWSDRQVINQNIGTMFTNMGSRALVFAWQVIFLTIDPIFVNHYLSHIALLKLRFSSLRQVILVDFDDPV